MAGLLFTCWLQDTLLLSSSHLVSSNAIFIFESKLSGKGGLFSYFGLFLWRNKRKNELKNSDFFPSCFYWRKVFFILSLILREKSLGFYRSFFRVAFNEDLFLLCYKGVFVCVYVSGCDATREGMHCAGVLLWKKPPYGLCCCLSSPHVSHINSRWKFVPSDWSNSTGVNLIHWVWRYLQGELSLSLCLWKVPAGGSRSSGRDQWGRRRRLGGRWAGGRRRSHGGELNAWVRNASSIILSLHIPGGTVFVVIIRGGHGREEVKLHGIEFVV